MGLGYQLGQLAASAVMVALIGGVIWAIVVMIKPRPPHEDDNEPDSDV